MSKFMPSKYDRDVVELLTILQDPNAQRARETYLKFCKCPHFDDRALFDQFERCVFDAIIGNDSSVEIDRSLAEALLLVLKKGIKRSRGGQPLSRHQMLRKQTLVDLGRRIKAELVDEGMSAIEAHMEAAEKVSELVKNRGPKISAGYLAREMQNAKH